MSEVISWTVAGGSLVFALGLISAIGSRRQRRSKPRAQILIREHVQDSTKRKVVPNSAMSMAAGGVGNGDEDLAPVGNYSR